MLLSSWPQSSKRSAPAARPRTPTAPSRPAGHCPMVESLEGRWLLSTLTVTTPADSGTGSLRNVIATADSGDTIVFSPTLFSSTQTSSSTKKGKGKSPPPPPPPPANTITLTSGQLALTKNLTIQGLGADQLTISGNYSSRVFDVAQGATVTLSGMTITKGFLQTAGGGILNNGTLTITNSTIAGNGAAYGGGVYNAGGTLNVGNSALGGNYADGVAGGGIYNAGGTVAVSNSSLRNNQSLYGGGIYNNGGTMTITNSTLSNNYAHYDYNVRGGYGGGIYNNAGAVTLSNSIISGNAAFVAGGIYNAAAGTVTVTNSTSITANTGGYDRVTADVNNLGVLYSDGTSTIGTVVGNPAILI
jgi:hypothetical protein